MKPLTDVVGVGASSIDFVYRLPAHPEPHGPHAKMRVTGHSTLFGGQTATAMATCASLGLRAKYVGAIGSEGAAAGLERELVRRGIDTAHAIVRGDASQFAVILIDERTGERIVLWNRDERLALDPSELPRDAIQSARIVHVDDVDRQAALAAAGLAREAGLDVTSDLDRADDLARRLVEAVTIPIFAEHVPPALTGETDLERALRTLRAPHHRMLCVTLGARGALLLAGDRVYEHPAFEVETVDTTGAGDVFRGAFICALLRGHDPSGILRIANAAAAVACTRLGALNGVPTLDEVIAAERRGPSKRI
jgi:sugar/nucleoside kinase (ribokinase family)